MFDEYGILVTYWVPANLCTTDMTHVAAIPTTFPMLNTLLPREVAFVSNSVSRFRVRVVFKTFLLCVSHIIKRFMRFTW